jgi:hypothetical protein
MLPYTAEVAFSLFARYLAETWPFAIAVALLTLSLLPIGWRRTPLGGRAAGTLLAIGWLWVGAVYHLGYFANINFAAPLYGGLFVLQATLLAWHGVWRDRLVLRLRGDAAGGIGLALVLLAWIAYPVADALAGHPPDAPRLPGLAPGPTALFTLGLLLNATRPVPLYLLLIPLAWSLVAGFNGWVLAVPADLFLPLPALAALGAALWARRQRPADARGTP